jgi:hypothetical protein
MTPTSSPHRSHSRLHTMWIVNVRNLPFEDQLRTTAAVGLDELSMTPLDFDRNIARGLSARDMRKMAEDNGVSLPILDPLASWAPHWTSGVSDPSWMQFLGYAPDHFFRIAGELEASTMTVIGTFSPGQVPIAQVTESFAAIADKAATHGIHCVLEFHPDLGHRRFSDCVAYRKDCEPFQRWPCIRLLGIIFAVDLTTPCCDLSQGTRSHMYRSRTQKRRCPRIDRFLMIACFIACLQARADYRSTISSKY